MVEAIIEKRGISIMADSVVATIDAAVKLDALADTRLELLERPARLRHAEGVRAGSSPAAPGKIFLYATSPVAPKKTSASARRKLTSPRPLAPAPVPRRVRGSTRHRDGGMNPINRLRK